jgi:succinate dehydrogenase/fumarate reductase flavoprotein subunit
LDLLDKEKGLKQARDQAIEYLDSISSNYDNSKDTEIEKKIMQILSGQEKALEQLDSHVNELKQIENEIGQELQIKREELQRAEKRLESIQHAAPSHQSELYQYESELANIYRIYVEKIRNHDYLQSKLEKYQKLEEFTKKNLKVLIEENKNNEQKNFHDQKEIMDIQEPEDYNNKADEGEDLEGEFDEDDEHF